MSELSELKAQLPITTLAQQVGADPAETEEAIDLLLPALVGGIDANAQDPAGAASIERALGHHRNDLFAHPDPSGIDTEDGEKIVRHIFGGQTDEVVTRLGGSASGGSSLIQKLLPIIAPIVLSWLASQVLGKMGQGGGAEQMPQPTPEQGGGLGDILGGILGGGFGGGTAHGGASRGGADSSSVQMPDVFTREASQDTRRRGDAAPQESSAQPGGELGDVLGGLLGGLLGGGRR